MGMVRMLLRRVGIVVRRSVGRCSRLRLLLWLDRLRRVRWWLRHMGRRGGALSR